MSNLINSHQEDWQKILDFFKKELASIRTGRANPAILDGVKVEAYGAKTPLVQLASINIPEARAITVEPWDKNVIKEVEKAIRQADLGINPVNEGGLIRLIVPQLTEESRRQLVKALNEKLEKARISLRSLRDRIKEEILRAEKNKEITEDDRFEQLKQLDETVGEYNKKIEELGADKEKEIMTV